MKIWRIETYRGLGPYCSSYKTLISQAQYKNFDRSTHPTPSDDKYLSDNLERFGFDSCSHSPLKYGFRDIEHCRQWFYNDLWIEDLEKKKFYLAEIEIDSENIAFGDKQLAFIYEKIKSKTRHSVKELLKYEP